MVPTKEIILVKHELLQIARNSLVENGFIEINTPKISFMPTDQDDHLFKTAYFGMETYLIQSPQFYKQAYVINGIDSVFEIAPVFRSEPRVTSRHLSEFISLDIESSRFKKLDDLINFETKLITEISSKLENKPYINPIKTFATVPALEIKKLLNVPADQYISPKEEARINEIIGADAVFVIDFPKNERVFYYDFMGDFSESYDLIVKGLEITSGGIRTTDYHKLFNSMKEVGINTDRYTPYLDLFKSGNIVRHGGFAIGIERIVSKLLNLDDVALANPYSKKPDTKTEVLLWNSSKQI